MFKIQVNEYCQQHKCAPVYKSSIVGGDAHIPQWVSIISIDKLKLSKQSSICNSKKDAEDNAAKNIIPDLPTVGYSAATIQENKEKDVPYMTEPAPSRKILMIDIDTFKIDDADLTMAIDTGYYCCLFTTSSDTKFVNSKNIKVYKSNAFGSTNSMMPFICGGLWAGGAKDFIFLINSDIGKYMASTTGGKHIASAEAFKLFKSYLLE